MARQRKLPRLTGGANDFVQVAEDAFLIADHGCTRQFDKFVLDDMQFRGAMDSLLPIAPDSNETHWVTAIYVHVVRVTDGDIERFKNAHGVLRSRSQLHVVKDEAKRRVSPKMKKSAKKR